MSGVNGASRPRRPRGGQNSGVNGGINLTLARVGDSGVEVSGVTAISSSASVRAQTRR